MKHEEGFQLDLVVVLCVVNIGVSVFVMELLDLMVLFGVKGQLAYCLYLSWG